MDHEFPTVEQDSSWAAGDLEAYHEYCVLFLRRDVFHVEDGGSSLQHPGGGNYYARSLRCFPSVFPAIHPVRHLASTIKHLSIPQRFWMLQQEVHRIKSHSVNKDWVLEMIGRQHGQQLLGSSNPESRYKHNSSSIHDFCHLLNELFLKPISDRMVVGGVGSLDYYRVEILVLWIRTIYKPRWLSVEVAGVEEAFALLLY